MTMEQSPFSLDISAVLRPGVYILRRHGTVVFVGKARILLTAIMNHRLALGNATLSRLFPHRAIHFDAIEIVPCTVDRAPALHAAMLALHSPTHQHPTPPAHIHPPPPTHAPDLHP